LLSHVVERVRKEEMMKQENINQEMQVVWLWLGEIPNHHILRDSGMTLLLV
jgi:hypothetical protein